MVTAAAFPTAMLTAAYGLLEMGRLRAGEVVLIHSAAGGVGSTAVQIAHAMGAVVGGTVSIYWAHYWTVAFSGPRKESRSPM